MGCRSVWVSRQCSKETWKEKRSPFVKGSASTENGTEMGSMEVSQ